MAEEIDYSTRKTAVTEKIMRKVPPSQHKSIVFQYCFNDNMFKLFNPYEYDIKFLDALKMDEVFITLGRELPEPASAVYVRNSQVLAYLIVLPILAFLLLDTNEKIKNKKASNLLTFLDLTVYLVVLGTTCIVLYVYWKNIYFDRMHRREKVMRQTLAELNRRLYRNADVVWHAGKYGLYFYGDLKFKRSRIALTQYCSEARVHSRKKKKKRCI